MFKVSTKLGRMLIARALYQKGIDSTVPFDKGQLAIKGMRYTDDDAKAFEDANKVKTDAYNAKLQVEKAAWSGDKDKFETSVGLNKERATLFAEIENAKDQPFEFTMGDDRYKALIQVCEVAQKLWYKAIQDKNECMDTEKRDKMAAPALDQFSDFADFLEDLNSAEKVKETK